MAHHKAAIRNAPQFKDLRIETVPVKKLKGANYNPREIKKPAMAGLRASVEKFGLVEPIVWNKRTLRVVGGHQRLKVLADMGVEKTQVVVVDLAEKDEKALNLALNNPGLQGHFTAAVGDIINELRLAMPDLHAALRMDDISVGSITLKDGHADPDGVPEPPDKAITRKGDLWVLGDHRLLCGDSTKPESYQLLMGQDRAAMMFTDPPWNVAIGQDLNPRHRQREGLANDALPAEDFEAFLDGFISAAQPYVDGDVYCVLAEREMPRLCGLMARHEYHLSGTIVWVKDSFVLTRCNYHRRYEPIWYGWHSKGKSSFCGRRDLDDVWEIPRPKRSEEHPTMKPVELMVRALSNSSRPGDIVLEPFSGSGSTVIACQRTGRRCRAIEIDPRYVDVAVQRWEEFTGKKATRQKA